MFSGIVEEKGTIQGIKKKENLYVLTIKTSNVYRGTKSGDSVSVDGVCLTVTQKKGSELTFDLMKETLDATKLKHAKAGGKVNLERALKVNSRLGGHFVTGHIDGVGKLTKIVTLPNYVEWRIAVDKSLKRYIVPKGSASLDGVSLTVGEVKKSYFSVYLIPHTLEVTTFGEIKVGDELNIETDLLAKYILEQKAS